MDFRILFSALAPFILFLCSLCILFRIVPEKKSIHTLFIAAGIGMLIACGFWANTNADLSMTEVDHLIGYIYVIGIYTGAVVLFLLSVFSVFEASLTLWFLSQIAGTRDGISKKNVVKYYGVTHIVEKRLSRLNTSGDCIVSEGRYTLGRTQSYFMVRENLLELYGRIFP